MQTIIQRKIHTREYPNVSRNEGEKWTIFQLTYPRKRMPFSTIITRKRVKMRSGATMIDGIVHLGKAIRKRTPSTSQVSSNIDSTASNSLISVRNDAYRQFLSINSSRYSARNRSN